MRLARKVTLVVGAIFAAGLLQAMPAVAHAKLVRADPKPGSTVQAAPKEVRAWFNEELDPKGSSLTIVDRTGKRVDNGKGGVDLRDLDRKLMVVGVAAMLRPGRYTVRWAAVSADDANVEKGSFTFTVAGAMSSGSAMNAMELPALRIVSPAAGATVSSPVILTIETPADLSKATMEAHSMEAAAHHLHIDLDVRVNMPTMKQLVKVGTNRYRYSLGTAAAGRHTIRAYWADRKHKPMGSVQTVSITVK
jgi:methionine-rich copper-binding protein CopC